MLLGPIAAATGHEERVSGSSLSDRESGLTAGPVHAKLLCVVNWFVEERRWTRVRRLATNS